MRHAWGSSTPWMFSSPVSITTKGESQSHHMPVPVMKSLRQLFSAQERFPHSFVCTQDGRILGTPITLHSERTRDSVPDPRSWRTPQGRPSRSY